MWVLLPMYSSQQKRKKRVPSKGGAKHKPFQAPRAAQNQRSVIPGQLYQTNTEKKVIFVGSNDTPNVALPLNSTGAIIGLNLIAVGSSMFNRIGRKIEMKSVRIAGFLYPLPVTRSNPVIDYARIMVIYDRQTNGAYPAMADILQDTEASGANTTDSLSGLNMDNRERFVTIVDVRMTIPQATNTAGAITNAFPTDMAYPCRFDEFRKLKGLTTHYKADSSPPVIGDISTGALYVLSFARTIAGSELFTLPWNVRLKYVDV